MKMNENLKIIVIYKSHKIVNSNACYQHNDFSEFMDMVLLSDFHFTYENAFFK